jgi:glycosyltransferase involved in cell wall biosynthesis
MSTSPTHTIGIDARAATEVPAGRGRVVRELLRALAARTDDTHTDDTRRPAHPHTDQPRTDHPPTGSNHRYILYARTAWEELPLDERFRWQLVEARDPLWHALVARAANRQCNVFLSSNSYLTTLLLRIPAVAIVYDLTTFEPSMRPNRRSTLIERLTLGPAVRRSATLLAISQATADALVARFPAATGRTVVVPLGVTPALGAGEDPLGSATLPAAGFVLAVGTLEPRKNLPRLVEAYRSLEEPLQREHPLVVVGALGWETGETLQALRALGERCTMLGHVSDAALAELYGRCAVFCYPSLGEGFGLPVLEAMAAGAAVLTSNVSSLPEVGGDAVAYADPHDARDIARELDSLLRDPSRRAALSIAARERAGEFSWERFAGQTLAVLERAAGDS